MRVQSQPIRGFGLRDFSGGVNVRDAELQFAANEVIDAWNMILDVRGGAYARLGFVKYNPSVFDAAAAVTNTHWSTTVSDLITQCGAKLYKGTSTSSVKTFTSAARVGFADFNGKVYAIHPVDGLFNSADGVTWAAVVDADAPKGDVLAVWQNKLWSAGNPTNSSRVSFSDAGNGESWTASAWVDLREKDDEKVVALTGGSGIDVAGRPGLLAFKKRSSYRIHDSATGAYMTIDPQVGAASGLAVVTIKGRTFALSEHGVYWTDGLRPMREVSAALKPLWSSGQINYAQLDKFAAGRLGTRLYLSLPRAGSAVNNLALTHDPDVGWFTPGSHAMACYATQVGTDELLYGGSPSVNGQVYRLEAGGTDDGAAIASRLQTRWVELEGSMLAHLWRLRIRGRGSPVLTVRTDFARGGGSRYPLALTDQAAVNYDTGLLYDTGLMYTEPSGIRSQDVHPTVSCRAVSLLFEATTTTTDTLPALLGQGSGPTVGGWGVTSVDVAHVPLAVG